MSGIVMPEGRHAPIISIPTGEPGTSGAYARWLTAPIRDTLAEAFRDMVDGPRFGPGRDVWRAVQPPKPRQIVIRDCRRRR